MSAAKFISEAEDELRISIRAMQASQEALQAEQRGDPEVRARTARALAIAITNAQTSLLWVQAAHFGGVS